MAPTELPPRRAHGLHHPDGQGGLQDGHAHVREAQRACRDGGGAGEPLDSLSPPAVCTVQLSPALTRMYGSFSSVSSGVPSTLCKQTHKTAMGVARGRGGVRGGVRGQDSPPEKSLTAAGCKVVRLQNTKQTGRQFYAGLLLVLLHLYATFRTSVQHCQERQDHKGGALPHKLVHHTAEWSSDCEHNKHIQEDRPHTRTHNSHKHKTFSCVCACVCEGESSHSGLPSPALPVRCPWRYPSPRHQCTHWPTSPDLQV